VFVSTDGGTTWIDRSDTNMRYFTRDITLDPTDPTQNTWYAGVWSMWGTSSGHDGLYKTTNRGQSWTLVPGTSGLSGITQAAFNPRNTNEMYLCTQSDGLWFSSNAHAASPTFSPVMSYPFGSPERVFFNPSNQREVWISSFGNGLRVGFDSSGLLQGDANMDSKVSFADYLLLEQAFGKNYQKWTNADFNGDGKVSFADYLLLEANFGKSINPPAPAPASAPVTTTLAVATAIPMDKSASPDTVQSNQAKTMAMIGWNSKALRPAKSSKLLRPVDSALAGNLLALDRLI
jgi:hypothetical protein